jgi:hypothetical protein
VLGRYPARCGIQAGHAHRPAPPGRPPRGEGLRPAGGRGTDVSFSVQTVASILHYRIRRRPDTPEARHEISVELDKIQSRIAFQHAWLQIETPEVAAAYDLLIRAARNEAGEQMKKAWTQPPPTSVPR